MDLLAGRCEWGSRTIRAICARGQEEEICKERGERGVIGKRLRVQEDKG
jgi:hypothetical protein